MRNMNEILRQAQVMQNKLGKLKEEAEKNTYEASSGGGMVKVVVNGNQIVQSVTIDPEAVKSGDVEMLQDLIISAVNEANRISRESLEREMTVLSNGIRLPGMF
ncbi:MAG: YbaB/EbfC family nucleoid-associated protein [Candidatus Desulfovibrio faecigallinarum]|uniref:YbaB/EbfC family nucleoid-associated protein n=1 Tax=Desulfovibrio sp. An276 TaxID=1965618 RepID=UPI000B3976AC|nr:YbaB/EbfC family nucleoid-associated protein [Desulfovibrio sp. An276]MBU3831930.1 YbaB/EbfC family nucleoid-associated protein [Candidatus Desulfovibrio faecigallinarum]OUO50035.1 YbaB/EbfC family nucleoid-associated protein [Desulfovibrio sp. An276]